MSVLSDADRARVGELLAAMGGGVRLAFFTQTLNCETCLPTKQILDELAGLTDKLSVDEHNFLLDGASAAAYGVDRVPAVVPLGEDGRDYGIRFLGIPSGYEFMSLIDAILLVSNGQSGLSDESRALLAGVLDPLTLQVFVTPT
ncbi:MAG: hypothetical protein AB1806_15870 [Acidobacteriota bacterium]